MKQYPVPENYIKPAEPEFLDMSYAAGMSAGLGLTSSASEPTQQQLVMAYEQCLSQKDFIGMVRCCLSIINASLMERDDFSCLPRWTAELSRLYTLAAKAVQHELEAELTCSMTMSLVCHDPGHPDLPRWINRGRNIMKVISDPGMQVSLGNSAVLYYLWTGNSSEVWRLVDEIRTTVDALQSIAPCVIQFRWIQVLSSIYSGCLDQAMTSLNSALVHANTGNIHIHDFDLLVLGAVASLMAGKTAKAQEFASLIRSSSDHSNRVVSCFIYLIVAWEMYGNGKLYEAKGHINKALELSQKINCPFIALWSRQLASQLYYDSGETDRAYFILAEARQVSLSSNSKIGEYFCCLLEAYFRLSRDPENKSGLEILRSGLCIGKSSQVFFQMGLKREALTFLCVKALEHEIEPGYVRRMVTSLKLSPESPPIELEQWPWPLKIYTLGRFGLVRDGVPLRFTGKVQQKPMEMLKALIAFGGRNVTEEKICDQLWPSAAGDDAHKSFVVTLHRLRRLLGDERFILYGEGVLSLNQQFCWVDVWAFNRHVGQGRALHNRGTEDLGSAIKAFQKAISLYNGNFLAGDARSPWAFSMREILRGKMIQIITTVGHCWEEAGDWRKAVENYLKGLETDDLVEEYYQRLMVCHQRMGDRGAALSVYKRCVTTLAMSGFKPSPKTKGIYETLICKSCY